MEVPWTLEFLADWVIRSGLQPRALESGNGIIVYPPREKSAIFTIYISGIQEEFCAEIAINHKNPHAISLQEVLQEKYDVAEPKTIHKWPRVGLTNFETEPLSMMTDWAKEHVLAPWSPKPDTIVIPSVEDSNSPSQVAAQQQASKYVRSTEKNISLNTWLTEFLSARGVDRPDGRPLYAYKTSDEEFVSINKQLRLAAHFRGRNILRKDWKFHALFVLFSAEWWRREYKGGPWSWDPILESTGLDRQAINEIRTSPQQLLYPALERGFRYWKRKIFTMERGRAFIGSIGVEGGLPLNLLTDPRAGLKQFFKHLLDRYLPLRSSGIPASQIASELQAKLPTSFRRETVFRVAGDIVESTLSLRSQFGLESKDDPVAHLDDVCPEWRERFSLSLDNEPAQALLRALVVNASKRSDTGLPLALIRYLARVADGKYILQARVELGRKLSISSLRFQFGEIEWPSQLEIWLLRPFKTRLAMLSRYDDEHYRVRSDGIGWHGGDALEEAVVGLFSYSNAVSEERVLQASPMEEELPWVFVEDDGRLKYLGQGGMSLAAESVTLVIPEAMNIASDSEQLESIGMVEGVGRAVYEIDGLVKVQGSGGEITIRTGQSKLQIQQYELFGERFYRRANVHRVFLGTPSLRCRDTDGCYSTLANTDVLWRHVGDGGTWQPLLGNIQGVVDIKALNEGELLFRSRVAILPKDAGFQMFPGKDQQSGIIAVRGLRDSRFASGNEGVSLEQLDRQGNITPLDLVRVDEKLSSFPLHLQWPHLSCSLVLDMPIPVAGAMFRDADGHWLDDRSFIAVSDLAGIHAIGFNHGDGAPEKFYLDINIWADDLRAGDLKTLADRIPLSCMGEMSELPLILLRERFLQLFSLSEDLDCRIELTLEGKRTYGRLHVARYTNQLDFDGDIIRLCSARYRGVVEQNVVDELVVEAHSLLNPLEHGRKIDPCLTQGVHTGEWRKPHNLNPGPWLVMPSKGQEFSVRPSVMGIPEYVPSENGRLRDAIAIGKESERRDQISTCITQMVKQYDHKDWQLVFDTLDAFDHLPATTLDLLDSFARNPHAMAMLLVKADQSNYQKVIDMVNELPFLWELVPLGAWVSSFHQLKMFIRSSAPSGLEETLTQHVIKEKIGYLREADPILEKITLIVSEQMTDQAEAELKDAEILSRHPSAVDSLLASYSEELRNRQVADVYWAEFHGTLLRDIRLNSPQVTQTLYTKQAPYMASVLHAPVAMAVRVCAQEFSTHERLSNTDLYQLQQIRQFDEQWYKEAFSLTTLYLYSQDLLIYESNNENSQ